MINIKDYITMISEGVLVEELYERLLSAIALKDVAMVRILLKKGAPVKGLREGWRTPIHAAAREGNNEIIDILLEHGAEIDMKNSSEYTALHFAARNNKPDTCKHLVDKGAEIEIKNDDGMTPLHVAAAHGCNEAISQLIDLGANIEAEDITEDTPLHHAVWEGNYEAAKTLLDNGANVEAVTNSGNTPLIYAVRRQSKTHAYDSRILDLILERGAKVSYQDDDDIDAPDEEPIETAIQRKDADIAKKLIEYGIRVEDHFTEANEIIGFFGRDCKWILNYIEDEQLKERLAKMVRGSTMFGI